MRWMKWIKELRVEGVWGLGSKRSDNENLNHCRQTACLSNTNNIKLASGIHDCVPLYRKKIQTMPSSADMKTELP